MVYHANYLRFLERGRTELLRARGITQADFRDAATGQPFAFVVRRMAIDFLRPARMDDLLSVETALAALGGASLDVAQTLSRGTELLVTAEVRVALVADGRARRIPAALRAQLTGGSGAL